MDLTRLLSSNSSYTPLSLPKASSQLDAQPEAYYDPITGKTGVTFLLDTAHC